MQKNPRIFLDLKKELPRRHWFRFNGISILLSEPTLSHIEKTLALSGIEYPLAQEFLKFVDWSEDNLADIMDFCEALPIGLLHHLLKTCREVFERSEEILPNMLDEVWEPIGEGIVRSLTERASFKNHARMLKISEDYLLEYLGVIVKPKPKKKENEPEVDKPKESWFPLTGAIDPATFNKIRKNLQYDPETFEEDIQKEVQERINSLNETKKGKKEKFSQAFNGKVGISLMDELDRANFTQLFHKMNAGFYRAVDDGVDLATYVKSAETMVNPVALKKRKEEKVDMVAEPETVKITSRWKGKK